MPRGGNERPRALVVTLLSVILIVAAAGSALAQEENYPGESFCRDVPAWPNGSYLGQMHPYHSEFYTRYAENRDWDPCVTWAADQRLSAMRGLAALGYTVIAPGETTPVAAPAPADTGNGEVPEENYPGENYCRDAPAWPNGTYLGQMHPYHSEFYTRYAENRDWDPCATWAADQQRSAIRGLRELGYTVLEPGEAVTAPAPAPAPAAAPMDDADAAVAYQQISGWNGGSGVLELPAGAHEIRVEFGGWGQGPVTLSYTTPDGETVTLIDNASTGYARAFTITAAVAGSYQFQVRAANDWRISVGTPPVAAAGSGGGGGGGAPGSGGDGDDGDDGDNGGGIVSCTFSGWIDPGGAHYQGLRLVRLDRGGRVGLQGPGRHQRVHRQRV